MSDEQRKFDPLEAVEDARRVEEIDGDEDLDHEALEREAPHESAEFEEPVLNPEGEVVPVPGHDEATGAESGALEEELADQE